MKLVSGLQMKQIDQEAITRYGIPSILLMEHAAYSVYRWIQDEYKEAKSISILCGPGNNGGDGLALARQLATWSSHDVKVILLATEKQLSVDGRCYYEICKQTHIPLIFLEEGNQIEDMLQNSEIIVDALFGTGLSRSIEGKYYTVIEKLNQLGKVVISVDIPSGIHADTGKVLGIAVKAHATITFALPKIGLYLYPGIDYVGKLIIADIGIPRDITKECATSMFTMDEVAAKEYLPTRSTRSNKGSYGKVFIIGGQKGMSGAVVLCATSCISTGAGTVTLGIPESIQDIISNKLTEAMTIGLPEVKGHFSLEATPRIKELIARYDVIAIGPGLGRSEEVKSIIQVVLASDKPCVIDADGLYALKPYLNQLKSRKAPTVLTPHPGEMAYLIDETIDNILEDPITYAKQFVEKYSVTLVLKLEKTLIVDQEVTYINTTGNNGLAKGGSGDVLTGIITALIGQKVPEEKAARLGVYMHGRAADMLAEEKTVYAVIPSEVSKYLGKVFKQLIN